MAYHIAHTCPLSCSAVQAIEEEGGWVWWKVCSIWESCSWWMLQCISLPFPPRRPPQDLRGMGRSATRFDLTFEKHPLRMREVWTWETSTTS